MNFLLVEDNKIAAWMIKNNLEQLGHRVAVAHTGKEAIDLFRRQYDAILLDVCLPDISGLEVARHIRLKEVMRNTILGISSLGNTIRKECLNAGFNEVYNKPTDIQELLKIIMGIKKDEEKKVNKSRGREVFRGVHPTNHTQIR